MSQRRVVVTGMGLVSPLGNDLTTSWDGIVNGRSGIGPVTSFDASAFTTQIAGEIRNFDPATFVSPKDAKKMDPFIHYGIAASFMALDDSGLEITEANAERIGRRQMKHRLEGFPLLHLHYIVQRHLHPGPAGHRRAWRRQPHAARVPRGRSRQRSRRRPRLPPRLRAACAAARSSAPGSPARTGSSAR